MCQEDSYSFLQGADIPDIKLVIQFGVPSSLSVWMQRTGCAGRSADINAHAVLLVKKSMFQWWKKWKKRGEAEEESELDVDDEEWIESEEEVRGDSEKMEWGKKVEPELQKWITTAECH